LAIAAPVAALARDDAAIVSPVPQTRGDASVAVGSTKTCRAGARVVAEYGHAWLGSPPHLDHYTGADTARTALEYHRIVAPRTKQTVPSVELASGPLKLDGLDEKRQIGFVYLDSKRLHELIARYALPEDGQSAAAFVAAHAQASPIRHIAVFVDPI